MDKRKVTVLYDSVEDRDQEETKARGEKVKPLVSEEVERVLAKRGHEVMRLAAATEAGKLAKQLAKDSGEVIFNVCESLNGVNQQEQNVAALLALFGKRYTGAPPIGLALAQDKALAKKILQFHGIRTPKFMVMHAGELEHADELDFPLFVKPSNEDASIGIDAGSVVRDLKELMERISYVQREFGAPALVEEFIDGRELYVGILETESRPEAMPILEWDFSNLPEGTPRIASSEAKWEEDNPVYRNTPEIFPDDLPPEVAKAIRDTAVDAYRALKLRDYGRVDLRLRRLDGEGGGGKKKGARKGSASGENGAGQGAWEFHVIEVNPNPHLASSGELALAARQNGISYPDLIETILARAMARPGR
jgi:D-alanine-D-alanine ligase